ncbi:nucleosome binding [Branchiostoma belcheri]|nr:nucleosome binding [Branchiostoma belcheri]
MSERLSQADMEDVPAELIVKQHSIKGDDDHTNNASHGQTKGRRTNRRSCSRDPPLSQAQPEQTFPIVPTNGFRHYRGRGREDRGMEGEENCKLTEQLTKTWKWKKHNDSRTSKMATFQTGGDVHSDTDLKEDTLHITKEASDIPDLELRRKYAGKRHLSQDKSVSSKRRKQLNGSSFAAPVFEEDSLVTTPEDSSTNGHNILAKDQEPEQDLGSENNEDSDSDDDLPDINTSLQQDPSSKPVNHVYHKKKRMSVLFIGYNQKKGISVNINAAKVFNSRMKDHFMEEASRTESKREFFQSIVTQVEDFLNKKACGKLDGLDAFQYFFPNETFPPDSPCGSDDDDEGNVRTHHDDTEATQSSALSEGAETSPPRITGPPRHNRRMNLRHNLEKRIVEYIKTQQDAKDHLAGIYQGSVLSQRHQDFVHKDRAVRAMLQGQGTGFITSDELAEDLFSCLSDLYLRCEEDKNFADTKYVACVLMPEAILYGLHKVKGISMKAAQELMDKGPELFPAERTWYREALRAEPLTEEERRSIIHQAAQNVLGREGSKQLLQLT